MQNRRQFLATLGATIGSSALVNQLSAMPADSRKYGLQLYTVRDDIGKDLEGTIKKVAAIGYKEVELAGYGNGQFYGKNPKDFKAMLAGATTLAAEVDAGRITIDGDATVFDRLVGLLDDFHTWFPIVEP